MYNRYYPYQYNRSEIAPKPPVPIPPPPLPPPHTKLPQKPKPNKKKLDIKTLKKDTCTSLNDVECFLNNFTSTLKYIKLINLLK